jgi:macrolide-specific efflux system membrane fusion protein
MTRRRTWVINGVLVVLLGGAGFGIYQAFLPAQNTAQAQTRSSAVTLGTVTATISAAGTVASGYTGSANFTAAGKVASINVAVGDVVSAGQKLATQDSTHAALQLTVAQANFAVAQENLTNGQTAATTATPTSSASQSAAAQAASITSLQAKLDQAQLDVDTAQAALLATVLTAPGAGTVTAINGTVGQSSGSGSSSSSQQLAPTSGSGTQSSSAGSSASSSSTNGFIVITDMSNLVMDTSIAEIDVSKVKVGQNATVTINALPNSPVRATVSKINLTPTTSGSVVSYGAQLALTNLPSGLRPGQSASVVITVAEATNALSVPAAAVLTVGNTSSVIVQVNGQDVRRQVQVGVRGESTVQITSGLSEGDRVVLTAASPSAATNGRSGAGGFGGTGGPGGAGGFGGAGGTRQGGGGRG